MAHIVFIVGTQRSGTTLLCHMLNAHDEYYVLNEFWSVYRPLTEIELPLSRLTDVLKSHLGLSVEQIDEWVDSIGVETCREQVFGRFELFSRAMQCKADAAGATTWGLKDPRLNYFMEPFQERYPDARFVFIVRDPRAVCASYLKRRMNVANVYYGAQLWRQQVQSQLQFAANYASRSTWVKYEDLVIRPEEELARICEFLGVTMTDDLLRFHENTPEFGVHAGNENVLRALDPSITEAWRKKLTPFQVGVIEGIASDLMDRWDYPHAGESVQLSTTSRAWFRLHNWVCTTYWWQRRSGWSGVRRVLGRN